MTPPRPPITGPRIIRFTLPTSSRRFTVHSDLICASSTLFSRTLASNRKPLTFTSICSICHDALDPIKKDIEFCKVCGQNVHVGCIEGWKRQVTREEVLRERNREGGSGIGGLPTCPMCRANWKDDPLLRCIHIKEELDVKAVQGYVNWLYRRQLVISEEVERTSDKFNVEILKCWAVAVAMEDETFRNEVVKTWFEEAEARFWSDSIKWVFVEDCGVKEIKEFVIEVFLAFVEPGWFREESSRWPEVFVRELSEWLLVGGKMRDFEEIKREWLGKLTGDEEEYSDEIVEKTSSACLEKGRTKPLSRVEKRNLDRDAADNKPPKKKGRPRIMPDVLGG